MSLNCYKSPKLHFIQYINFRKITFIILIGWKVDIPDSEGFRGFTQKELFFFGMHNFHDLLAVYAVL